MADTIGQQYIEKPGGGGGGGGRDRATQNVAGQKVHTGKKHF